MRLKSVNIQGYRPFRNFEAQLEPLEIIVGANGSGKSSLFEFLKFLRDSLYQDIPPEIISGSIGQQIFHIPGPAKFQWNIEIDTGRPIGIRYLGELMGPVGRTQVSYERVESSKPFSDRYSSPYIYMDIQGNKGVIREPGEKGFTTVTSDKLTQDIALKRSNQLTLNTMTNPSLEALYNLREYIREWRFYSSFNIANQKIRQSVPIEQEPILHENAGNLSSVLFSLMTEHRPAFDELQQHLRSVIPGFKGLTVKARGGPGEVIAFWQESGVDDELSLADLSDGILRLICWICLCVQPNPPSLICIDEPDQGVHPRTLPVLAALFEKASERTQILLATHSSYFLTQFDISQIAVLRKEKGEAKFIKPGNSPVLIDMLDDFGADELEQLHRSDELERLP
ncbi:AAA family ATPase [Dolichospermum sp. ST_sed1]|nr:AAA family ATPase [Dolichospermum sp. ST_sed1]MDD1423439.1 AAA family ATPase [Dolichospermum sp. ST_sed9]MDD1431215.1 AAA family ATPase [Dolichospermum sp. ST_sed6]MDD1435681.1 AAA family ATPase [Dolichospermum sp. ST_sed10]MDD1440649.1 AAA family ATPase [Dolichospermum sp. ST_sed3]MDD1446600.1 AAA family ATPase [Dolichospermum sp. ST_sed8]MDD1455444.1 AAA family ATPase [Dolichospermum sp. ST_sed7]MDD1460629.1 AAA family ATPase [Dolichospermum sp. ST_sed2]MDD1466334.1 AAA family ATPase [